MEIDSASPLPESGSGGPYETGKAMIQEMWGILLIIIAVGVVWNVISQGTCPMVSPPIPAPSDLLIVKQEAKKDNLSPAEHLSEAMNALADPCSPSKDLNRRSWGRGRDAGQPT